MSNPDRDAIRKRALDAARAATNTEALPEQSPALARIVLDIEELARIEGRPVEDVMRAVLEAVRQK